MKSLNLHYLIRYIIILLFGVSSGLETVSTITIHAPSGQYTRATQIPSGDILIIDKNTSFNLKQNQSTQTYTNSNSWSSLNTDGGSTGFIPRESGDYIIGCLFESSSDLILIGVLNDTTFIKINSPNVIEASSAPNESTQMCGLSRINSNTYLLSYMNKDNDKGVFSVFHTDLNTIVFIREVGDFDSYGNNDLSTFNCHYIAYVDKIICVTVSFFETPGGIYFYNNDSEFTLNTDHALFPYKNTIKNIQLLYTAKVLDIREDIIIAAFFGTEYELMLYSIYFESSEVSSAVLNIDEVGYRGTDTEFNYFGGGDDYFVISSLDLNKVYLYLYSITEKKVINTSTMDLLPSLLSFHTIKSVGNSNTGLVFENVSNNLIIVQLDIIECNNTYFNIQESTSGDIILIQLIKGATIAEGGGGNSYNDGKIKFLDLPDQEDITFKTEGLNNVEIDTFYTGIKYEYYKNAPISVKYVLEKVFESLYVPSYICESRFIDQAVCNVSCNTCEIDDGSKCITCNNQANYFMIENSGTCSDVLPNGYYFDIELLMFVQCYETCGTCEDKGNEQENKCLTCSDGYIKRSEYVNNESNKFECTGECVYYWYINDDGVNINCTILEECPSDYPELNLVNKQCLKVTKPEDCEYYWYINNDNKIKCTDSLLCPDDYPHLKSSNKECTVSVDNTEIKIPDDPKDAILLLETDISTLFESKPVFITDEYQMHFYTVSEIDKESTEDYVHKTNSSLLLLKDCEITGRKYYDIPEEDDLNIVIVDLYNEFTTNQIEYSIYHDAHQLNTSGCNETPILIITPLPESSRINITLANKMSTLNIDIFNKSDVFFNDYCYPYTTETNEDIIITDRRDDIFQSLSLCDDDCEYRGVNLTTNTTNCECKPKTEISPTGKVRLEQAFTNTIMNSNIKVINCYKNVFSVQLLSNPGFIVMMFLGMSQFINLFIGIFIKDKLRGLVLAKASLPKASPIKIQKQKNTNTRYSDNNSNSNIVLYSYGGNVNVNESTQINHLNKASQSNRNSNTSSHRKDKRKINKKKSKMIVEAQINTKRTTNNINSNTSLKVAYKAENENNVMEKKKNDHLGVVVQEKLSEKEININDEKTYPNAPFTGSIEYEIKKEVSTITITKTTSWVNYLAIIREHHIIYITFFRKIPGLIRCGNISLYLLSITMSLAFNALFYSDSYISENYKTKGFYKFFNEIPKVIYSLFMGSLLQFFFSMLTKINPIKQSNTEDRREGKINLIKFKGLILCKLLIFFSGLIIFNLFFTYFVCAFCSVYKNSVNRWVISAILSVLFAMIIPVIVCAIIYGLRKLSIKHKSQCLFALSEVLSFIF